MNCFELEAFLIDEIRRKGKITFKDFMEDVLYHPSWGYYNSSYQKVGKGGDFYTSPHVSWVFGKTLAKQLIEMADHLGWDDLIFLEYGGGEGYLAKDILEAIWELRPDQAKALTYYLLERSLNHQSSQKELLKDLQAQVKWVNNLEEVSNGKQIKAIVFSNELIDAFPVHRVKLLNGELKEIYVEYQDAFFETFGELSDPMLGEYFSQLDFHLEEGQEAEINLAAVSWLKDLGQYLQKGYIITIDYGYLLPELKFPHRFAGTVMCYSKHQSDDKPLEKVGLKDISSHVNFTALMEYGKQFGFKVAGYTNQMKFLVGLQIGDWLVNPSLNDLEKQKLSMALKELLMPEKMGERFKVLIQKKGTDESLSISGLKGFS